MKFMRLASEIISIAALLSLLAVVASPAAASEYYYIPPMPADFEQVDFFLLTSGVGDEVANRFGHTGIRVLDRRAQTDVVFNWGKFSFDAPHFLWRFFRGELTYSMGVRGYQGHVSQGVEQKRRMWQDRLYLTVTQKRTLISLIAANARPENRDFSYQYWYKNCATIPRDYIDQALEGAVRSRFYSQYLETRYRDYVRANLQAIPFVVPSLDVIMNSNVDRPITAWQDMFLPVKLREHLLTMAAVDDDGNPVAGQSLLTDSEVLLPFEEAYAAPFNDYLALTLPIVLLLSVGLALWMTAKRQLGIRCIGMGILLFGIVSSAFAWVMTLNWLISGHPDTWSNANLFIFCPLDLIYVAVGIVLIKNGRELFAGTGLSQASVFLSWAHLASLGILIAGAALGGIEQDVWPVVRWLGTLSVAIMLMQLTIVKPTSLTSAK